MKFVVNYKFTEEFIPPRCRKARYKDVEDSVTVTVKEISLNEAPIALIKTDYETRNDEFGVYNTEYRWYKNALYALHKNQFGANILSPYTVDDIARDLNKIGKSNETIWKPFYSYYYDKKDKVKMIRDKAKKYIIIGNEIWSKTNEPRYCIYTFGLGHNHGGSSLSIDNHYNNNISKSRYFNAIQRKEAIEYFEKIALGRGDDKSIQDEYVEDIQVLIPEAVKCNPNKEHGNGCSFINSIEGLISGTGSSIEAGLLTMAVGMAEISKVQ